MQFPEIPIDEFVLYARLYAKPGQGDRLERHLRALVRLAQSEPGTLDYVISRDPDMPETFHVYEKYTGRGAFVTHIESQEFQDFINSGYLAEDPAPKMLKPLGPL